MIQKEMCFIWERINCLKTKRNKVFRSEVNAETSKRRLLKCNE
jgi:hypothetical protein